MCRKATVLKATSPVTIDVPTSNYPLNLNKLGTVQSVLDGLVTAPKCLW